MATPERPWLKHYPAGVAGAFGRDDRPVFALLEEAAACDPAKTYLEFLGRSWSYGEVAAQVDIVAANLRQRGLKKGRRVALCLPNCPYFVILYFAVLKAGGVVVNVNPLYTQEEIRGLLADSGAAWVATIDLRALQAKVRAAAAEAGVKHVVICPLGEMMPPLKGLLYRLAQGRPGADTRLVPWRALAAAASVRGRLPPVRGRDLALLQYTGGTTGTPKGAMLTHANLMSNTGQVKAWLGRGGEERILAVLPLVHVFALIAALHLGTALGATLILLPRFNAAGLRAALRDFKPTLLPGVPALFDALAGAAARRTDFVGLRYCISGGAPLPAAVALRFKHASGLTLHEGYGLTEAGPVVACNATDGVRAGSAGLPLPGTVVEIRDPRTGRRLAAGARGEVWVKGPQVMRGYWRRPAASRAVLKGGWLRTGDVGHLDRDGYLFLTDRLKDLIIVNGYKVYPRVVEDALARHPAVAEVLVAGIADPRRGEAAKAYVRLRPGSNVTAAEILAFAAANLNPIERPVAVELRTSLPRTLIGKPSRRALAEEHK
jgi:long-chain acyl-CoA synthetase